MAWAFTTEVDEKRRVTITCGGDLVVSGTRRPELAADVQPADVTEAEAEVTLHFDETAHVTVFERVAGLEVEHVAGELRARRLSCALRVVDAVGDVEIADHQGGVEVRKAAGDVSLARVNGGISIDSAGDIEVSHVNGGVHVRSCGGDLRVTGLSGGLKVDSCAGDLAIETMSGGVDIETLAGDLKLTRLSGGMRLGSLAGDLHIENVSGGLDAGRVAGDGHIRILAGGMKLREVGGDCTIESQSGSVELGEIGGDLTLRDASGSVHVEQVGGALAVRKAAGQLRFDRVGEGADLARIEAGSVSLTAIGDILFEGKLEEDARCELVSEGGGITVELPEDTRPVLVETSAGGEVICDLTTARATDPGPRVTLRAAGDISLASSSTRRRPGRPRREESLPAFFQGVSGPARRSPEEQREERLIVLRMVESGKVTADEGARLLEAIGSG